MTSRNGYAILYVLEEMGKPFEFIHSYIFGLKTALETAGDGIILGGIACGVCRGDGLDVRPAVDDLVPG